MYQGDEADDLLLGCLAFLAFAVVGFALLLLLGFVAQLADMALDAVLGAEQCTLPAEPSTNPWGPVPGDCH